MSAGPGGRAGVRESGGDRPWVTVVTPSYEQAEYLADCVRSVPSEEGRGPDVEHVVVDGGSEDGTVEFLERAGAGRNLRWVSEPDDGHGDAVNKGLRAARGEWIGIQNSDDYYLEGAFAGLERAMAREPGHDAYYGNVLRADAEGRPLQRLFCSRPSPFVHRYRGLTVRHQSLFLRREAVAEVGGWREVGLALDWEWVGRLIRSGLSLRHVPETWAAFRVQPASKSERAGGEAWRRDLDAAAGGTRYPGGRLARPFLRGAAAALQWAHIVADNGPGAALERLAEKAGVRTAGRGGSEGGPPMGEGGYDE